MTQSAKKGKRMVMLQKASHQMLQKQQHGMPRKVLHTLSLSMFSKGERGKGHEGMSQELYQALKAESAARRHPSGYMSRRCCGEVGEVIEAGVTVDAIWDAFGMCLDREPWRTSFFSRDFMEWQRHVVEKRRKNARARTREDTDRTLREEMERLLREAQAPRTSEELADREAAIERVQKLGVFAPDGSGRGESG